MRVNKVLEKRPDARKPNDYAVYFLEMDDGSRWVWKPDGCNTALKEVIAYRMSEWMGLHIVPETIPYEWEDTAGSLQRFVEGKVGSEVYREGRHPSFQYSQRLGLLDLILNNNDRWHSNVIIEDSGRIWAIDNGGILQPRDAWAASALAIVGRTFEPAVGSAAVKARTQIKDFIREIFSVEVEGREGPTRGTDLWVGVNIACEKIASLAPAVGVEQCVLDTWGSIEFYRLAEEAGYPGDKYGPK